VDWIADRARLRPRGGHDQKAPHGGNRWSELAGHRRHDEGTRIAVGQSASMVNIALGAIDKALIELKTMGRMTEAQKGSLSRETADKVEQVEELNARSRKYNLPAASAPERQP
jgi:hypothetical protein